MYSKFADGICKNIQVDLLNRSQYKRMKGKQHFLQSQQVVCPANIFNKKVAVRFFTYD